MECSNNYFLKLITDTNFIASVIGAILSGLFAILVFRYGIKSEKKHAKAEEQLRLSELKIYFETLVLSLKGPIDIQIKEMDAFVNQISEKKFKDYDFKTIKDLDLEYLKKIDHKDLFTIYISKKGETELRTKEFKALIDNIDLLKSKKDFLNDLFSQYKSKYESYQKEFQDSINSIHKLYTASASSITSGLRTGEDRFIKSIEQIFKKWVELPDVKTDKSDPYIIVDHIILPMLKLCEEQPFHPSVNQFSMYCRDGRFTLENNDALREFLTKHFNITKEELNTAKGKIYSSLEKLK